MPADVFYSLTADDARPDSARKGQMPERAPRSPRRRNVSKPQYCSFESALLVESLTDTVRQHAGSIVFEEMLPRPDMLSRWGGDAHMTELVFQIDGEQ